MGEQPLHRALGLTDDEYAAVERILGREPNHLELAMFAVMWSEHCSYKSSRLHLRRLPSEASWVLEENQAMRQPLEAIGGRVYRRWRIFERAIGSP